MECSIIALFIIVFISIYSGTLATEVALAGEAVLLIGGFVLRQAIDPLFTGNHPSCAESCPPILMLFLLPGKYFLRGIRSIIVLVCTLFGLSPVLKTLVESVSNDTIWALTIFFFVLHLAFADYSYMQGNSDRHASSLLAFLISIE